MAQRAVRVADEPAQIADELDIIREVEDNPVVALTNEAKFNAYFAAVEAQARAVPVDLETSTGRDRIKSAAAQVARKKTAIDNAGKAATEEWRRLTGQVNAVRNVAKERFDALRDDIRRPVTEWENAEEARRAEADLIIENLRNAAIVRADETSDDIQARLDRVRGHNLNSDLFGPRIELVTDLRDDTVKALTDALERIKQAEADRAELARLRRESEEREERERQERAAAQAREDEEKRKAADAARIEREREEAAQRAKDEAERAHKAEQDRIAQEKQAEIDAANERARKAEADAAAERKKAADAEAARKAEADRLAAEQAKRDADQEHRTNAKKAAKEAIMSCGVSEEAARKVVMLSVANELPHMPFKF